VYAIQFRLLTPSRLLDTVLPSHSSLHHHTIHQSVAVAVALSDGDECAIAVSDGDGCAIALSDGVECAIALSDAVKCRIAMSTTP
jgi:hypothetical protein